MRAAAQETWQATMSAIGVRNRDALYVAVCRHVHPSPHCHWPLPHLACNSKSGCKWGGVLYTNSGHNNCSQPYYCVCIADGGYCDEQQEGSLKLDGTVRYAQLPAAESPNQWTIGYSQAGLGATEGSHDLMERQRRSCDQAVINRQYSRERSAALRRESRLILLD